MTTTHSLSPLLVIDLFVVLVLFFSFAFCFVFVFFFFFFLSYFLSRSIMLWLKPMFLSFKALFPFNTLKCLIKSKNKIKTTKEIKCEGHLISKGKFFGKKKKNFFWIFFSINVNSAKIILILQKYLFSEYSKGRQIKQISSSLNRGLSSTFWWSRNANHMKFTDKYVMCIETHTLYSHIQLHIYIYKYIAYMSGKHS